MTRQYTAQCQRKYATDFGALIRNVSGDLSRRWPPNRILNTPVYINVVRFNGKTYILYYSVFYLYGAAACQLFIKPICYVMYTYMRVHVLTLIDEFICQPGVTPQR